MSKKIHRFFVPLIRSGNTVSITDTHTLHHMVRVLCLEVGEYIEVVEEGIVVTIAITELHSKQLKGTIIKEHAGVQPKRTVTLALAIIKKDMFELVVSKASELGVSRIIPLITARTIKKELRLERLRDIAREAIEQSEQTHLPIIEKPQTLKEVLEIRAAEVWIGVPHATTSLYPNNNDVLIIIGPEGGFTDEEVAYAHKANAREFGLTSSILKAETAAIIATYQALA